MLKHCVPLGLLACAAFAKAPQLRLPENVSPVRYRLEVTLITAKDDFSGKIEIDLDVHQPVDTIWLNSRNLTVDKAELKTGSRVETAKVQQSGEDFAGFTLPSTLPPGKATLRIAYHGALNKKGSSGFFKEEEGGEWYIYSQFEAISARQAFPCFDEPSYKVPWQLTLHVMKDHSAFSNTPITSENDDHDGNKQVVFAETKPLPSYLVALAVGPFEVVDGGKHGKKQTPLRVIVPKGKRAEAKYAAEVTGPILEQLENYFGIPYPYDKLDSVAVPLFGGAMENPGMITYAQTLILHDPTQDSIDRQRGYAGVAAHEMAHLWFGDLVTTAWWNDIWLNEAFASWMSSKAIAHWKPEWNTKIDEQNTRLGAMEQDGLVSARRIRQPIGNNSDIANAFDGITYSKGEAVISMFEGWLGEETFRKGVQQYLRQYSWRNATAGDFLDSLSSTSQQPVAAAFSTFLDQAGEPLVSVAVHCDSAGGARLELTQKRALPLGSAGSADQTWQIPVCVRYDSNGQIHRECTLLTQASQEWRLPEAHGCPAWVLANADGVGYYRARYENEGLSRLLANAGKLSATERVATLGDVQALAAMGSIPAGDALALAPQYANDSVRQVVDSAVGIASGVRDNLVPADLRPNYARFIDQSFGERARRLGWEAAPGEDADARLLREAIVPLVAIWGEDHTLAAEGRRLAESWLKDRKSVDPNIVGPALRVASRTGDQTFFNELVTALGKTKEREEREHIIGALGSFLDPKLARAAMDLMLKPDIDIRECFPLIFGPLSAPQTKTLPFEFVQEHYEAILAKLPPNEIFNAGAFLPFVGSVFCSEEQAKRVSAFFEPKVAKFDGAPRNLAQSLESIRLCTAYKGAQEHSVVAFLKKY